MTEKSGNRVEEQCWKGLIEDLENKNGPAHQLVFHRQSSLTNSARRSLQRASSPATSCILGRLWLLRKRAMSSIHRSFGWACFPWALRLRPEKCSSGSHFNICLDHLDRSWLTTLCANFHFTHLTLSTQFSISSWLHLSSTSWVVRRIQSTHGHISNHDL